MTSKAGQLRLSVTREQELAELAEAIADEYFPTLRIEPLAIIQAKEITSSFGYYGDSFDGLLEHQSGRFHIYANLDRLEQSDSTRARFTLGHELGHYFIDEHRNAMAAGLPPHPSVCEYESDLLIEREADHFASSLLMPPTRFGKRAQRMPRGMQGILNVAHEFGTSLTSTAIKYVRLDILPCLVMKWSNDRLEWKWLSTETFEAPFRRPIESFDKLQPDSPTARAIRGERPPASGFFSAGTTASAWFPFVSGASSRNTLFIEESIQLGRFGVLTFLYPEAGSY
ncbi:MAG TPA: ImmA/IrrE family metallo-endopeptidase [Pyrinomonadaceae bacterium]|nr:ImmA/IrrE family metallo-endopeptidase [Pyrinomonadaceae bacterium]